MKQFIVILLSFFYFHISIAQNADYNILHFNSENGLPTNGIGSAALDETTGFLWISSDGGLLRYDGNSFKVFDENSRPKLPGIRVPFFAQSFNKSIYFGNEWGVLFTIQGNNFKQISKGFTNNNHNFSEVERLKLLWVSYDLYCKTNASVLDKNLFRTSFRPIALSDTSFYVKGDPISYYYATNKGAITFPKWTNGLVANIFNVQNQTFAELKDKSIYTVALKDSSINLTPASLKGIDIKSNQKLYFYGVANNSFLFYNQQLYSLQYQQNQLLCKPIITINGLDGSIVKHIIALKHNKEIFLATSNQGFYILKRNNLLSQKQIPHSPISTAYTAYQLKLNDSTIATDVKDIWGSNKPTSLPINHFTQLLYIDRKNNIWHSGDRRKGFASEIHLYNPKTNTDEKIASDTSVFRKYATFSEYNDTIYFIINEGILGYVADKPSFFVVRFPRDKNAVATQYFDFMPDKKNNWLVASSAGLLRYYSNNPGKIDTIIKSNNISFRTLFKLGKYYVIGSYGAGIYMYDGINKVKQMPLDQQHYLSYAHCFVKDSLGNFWISSNKGIYQTKAAYLIKAFEDSTVQSIYYKHYGIEDGMETTELNGGCKPCAVVFNNSTISFPSVKGLVWIKPNKLVLEDSYPLLFVDECYVNGVLYESSSYNKLTIPSNSKEIVFKLAYEKWAKTVNNYVYYTLDDEPEILLDFNLNGKLQLVGLSYGKHRLNIKRIAGFEANSVSTLAIEIYVSYPWYLKWWVVPFEIILFGLFIYLFVKWRTINLLRKQEQLQKIIEQKTKELKIQNEELKKKDSIKTRLIAVISHDIINPLRFIYKTSKYVKENYEAYDKETVLESIDSINSTSQELEILSSNMLNWIKHEHSERIVAVEVFELHSVIQKTISSLSNLIKDKQLNVVNQVPTGFKIQQKIEPIRIIVYNLLLNAIQFSKPNTSIYFSLIDDGINIGFSVKDEGVGMTAAQIDNVMNREFVVSSINVDAKRGSGLGYMIIKDSLKILDAEIKINSSVGVGTNVEIIFT